MKSINIYDKMKPDLYPSSTFSGLVLTFIYSYPVIRLE